VQQRFRSADYSLRVRMLGLRAFGSPHPALLPLRLAGSKSGKPRRWRGHLYRLRSLQAPANGGFDLRFEERHITSACGRGKGGSKPFGFADFLQPTAFVKSRAPPDVPFFICSGRRTVFHRPPGPSDSHHLLPPPSAHLPTHHPKRIKER